MIGRQRAVGIFPELVDTERALQELNRSHYLLERVFVIANNIELESQMVATQLCQSLRERFDTKIRSTSSQDAIALSDALTHLDIPVDIARKYDDLVAKGQYLVMVEGSDTDLLGAKTILQCCGIKEWVVYKIVLEHPEVIIVDRR